METRQSASSASRRLKAKVPFSYHALTVSAGAGECAEFREETGAKVIATAAFISECFAFDIEAGSARSREPLRSTGLRRLVPWGRLSQDVGAR
jgi:hypothetical protein